MPGWRRPHEAGAAASAATGSHARYRRGACDSPPGGPPRRRRGYRRRTMSLPDRSRGPRPRGRSARVAACGKDRPACSPAVALAGDEGNSKNRPAAHRRPEQFLQPRMDPADADSGKRLRATPDWLEITISRKPAAWSSRNPSAAPADKRIRPGSTLYGMSSTSVPSLSRKTQGFFIGIRAMRSRASGSP